MASCQARCIRCFTVDTPREDDSDRFHTGEPILSNPTCALNPAVVLVGARTIGG